MTDDEKSEQCKEVYAQAGLCLYWAQCLEKSLENFLLLHARVTGECITLMQLDKFEERIGAQTLGRLLSDTRRHVQFKNGSEELLTKALERRNFLVHHFFKERAEEFMSGTGRARMITELIEIRDCFRSADLAGSVICKGLQKVLGISDELLEKEFKRMVPNEN